MSALPADRVYQGFWIDHTSGAILGSTITLKSQATNVIVALVSVVITFAGSHLWDLVTFTFFQVTSTDATQDGFYHQRQAILRNSASPGTAFMDLLKTWLGWRNHADRLVRRLALLLTLAVICSLGFLVGGLLSSLIVTTESINVLVQSSTCGYLVQAEENVTVVLSNTEADAVYYKYADQLGFQAGQYAETCYNQSSSNPRCTIYRTHDIKFTTKYTDSPFGPNVTMKRQRAIQLDTGHLDSHLVFGINTKPEDRVSLQKLTTCVPLNLTDYQTTTVMTDEDMLQFRGSPAIPGEKMYAWYLDDPAEQRVPTFNMLDSFWSMSIEYIVGSVSGQCAVESRYPNPLYGSCEASWIPTDALFLNDSDVSVTEFSAGGFINHHTRVDDPIFSSHRQRLVGVGEFGEALMYSPDYIATFIGCSEQYQICIPSNSSQCTPFTTSSLAFIEASYLKGFNLMHAAILVRFARAIVSGGADITNIGKIHPLLVENKLVSLFEVPSNQWELEIQFAHAVELALIQGIITNVAMGPGVLYPQYDSLPREPLTKEDRMLCHSQLMKAPNGFSNINVFGLSFIIAFCLLIVLLNLTLTNVVKWLARRNIVSSRSMVKWDQDGLLQVQRKAFEGLGVGGWSRDRQSVPIKKSRDFFEDLSSLSNLVLHGPSTAASATPMVNIISPPTAMTTQASGTGTANSSNIRTPGVGGSMPVPTTPVSPTGPVVTAPVTIQPIHQNQQTSSQNMSVTSPPITVAGNNSSTTVSLTTSSSNSSRATPSLHSNTTSTQQPGTGP